MKIKKGQIIALTKGGCSDYSLRGHARALCSFETKEVISDFMQTSDFLRTDLPSSFGNDYRFTAWAIRKNLIEPLEDGDVVEWCLGSYGELGIES